MERIAQAKGALARGSFVQKAERITKAVNIVQGLQGSLSDNEGGELTANLDELYDYVIRTLIQANQSNNAAKLDECARLLGEIKSGWDQLSEQRSAAPTAGAYS